MENLIKEAFLYVADLGPRVANGQYDLLGPKDEIIMPSIWELVIQPGWEITMHMWPIPEPPPDGGDALAGGMANIVIVEPGMPPSPPGGRIVDGVLLPLKEQPVIHADFNQKRMARKKRKRSRHLWSGLRASQRKAEEPLKERSKAYRAEEPFDGEDEEIVMLCCAKRHKLAAITTTKAASKTKC